ncbi:helix-turn-helix domain-containing protein [Methylobacterium nodulans]|uniref:Helix-turn-helix domain-containing protein n=1 Tax=Methylobacterium nodulans (strain LMG 21967 / CNCM I-2342 / ORS 2060) TaxID=460265 RepID=B8IY70_METNO|nr:helix-turn-helix domain-containing protein [Methylobacterium nodulans]ACL63360.1 hypothetical protein Mnod_7769 [Methylobacterium nodulans ORS 2060]
MEDELMTQRQLAAKLKVCLRTLERELATAKDGPPEIRPSPRRILYRSTDVNRWLEARTVRRNQGISQ